MLTVPRPRCLMPLPSPRAHVDWQRGSAVWERQLKLQLCTFTKTVVVPVR